MKITANSASRNEHMVLFYLPSVRTDTWSSLILHPALLEVISKSFRAEGAAVALTKDDPIPFLANISIHLQE